MNLNTLVVGQYDGSNHYMVVSRPSQMLIRAKQLVSHPPIRDEFSSRKMLLALTLNNMACYLQSVGELKKVEITCSD